MTPVTRSKSALCLPSDTQDRPTTLPAIPSPPLQENLLTSYFTDPEPPQLPNPWVWRCHLCHITYRLGCTRRCLECSHEFCTTLESSSSSSSSKTSRTSKKRSRSKRGGPCKAEFDYAEWQNYGAWRRTIMLNDKPGRRDWGREADATTDSEREEWTKKKDTLFILRKHDCWQHCDYPSECRHAYYAALVEGRTAVASPTIEVTENEYSEMNKDCTSDDYNYSNIAEVDETMQGDSDTKSTLVVTVAEQQSEFDFDLSDPDAIEDEEDLDPSVARALRGRQERRSQRKLARLTGLESLSPLDAIDTVSSVLEANRLLNNSSDQQLASAAQRSGTASTDESQGDGTAFTSLDLMVPRLDWHERIGTHFNFEGSDSQRSGKRCKASSSQVSVASLGADEWESWSDSSSSSSSSSSTLTDADSTSFEATEEGDSGDVCPVSYDEQVEDEDMSTVDKHHRPSGERDLIALFRLRNAFMRDL